MEKFFVYATAEKNDLIVHEYNYFNQNNTLKLSCDKNFKTLYLIKNFSEEKYDDFNSLRTFSVELNTSKEKFLEIEKKYHLEIAGKFIVDQSIVVMFYPKFLTLESYLDKRKSKRSKKCLTQIEIYSFIKHFISANKINSTQSLQNMKIKMSDFFIDFHLFSFKLLEYFDSKNEDQNSLTLSFSDFINKILWDRPNRKLYIDIKNIFSEYSDLKNILEPPFKKNFYSDLSLLLTNEEINSFYYKYSNLNKNPVVNFNPLLNFNNLFEIYLKANEDFEKILTFMWFLKERVRIIDLTFQSKFFLSFSYIYLLFNYDFFFFI